MPMHIRNRLMSAVMFLICIVFFYELRRPKYSASVFLGQGFDPAMFPRILLWAWAAFSIVIFLTSFSRKNRFTADKGIDIKIAKITIFVPLVLIYGLLIQPVGFIISTLFFMILFMQLAGYTRLLVSIPTALVFTVSTWWIFTSVLGISLP